MKIQIIHQYHNNMYDTVKALEEVAKVEFLSYRTSKLVPEIKARQPRVWGKKFKIYMPWDLWRLIPQSTDLVILKHINDPINFFPYLFCWLKGIKCMVVVQRPTERIFPGYRFIQSLLVTFLKYSNVRIMSITKEGHHWATSLGLTSQYIPACINPNRFKLQQRTLPTTDSLRLLTVSKYQDRKNLPVLIQALAELQKKYPRISFFLTIIGSLSDKEASHKEYTRVKAEIKRLHLEKSISLHTNIPYHDMPAHYAKANAFILPAESEPLGYAVVEAMASGLPILCSSDVGAASYVIEGKNGYVFKPRSSQAIVTAMEKIITSQHTIDIHQLSNLGKASYIAIEQQHTPTVFLNSFQILLNSF